MEMEEDEMVDEDTEVLPTRAEGYNIRLQTETLDLTNTTSGVSPLRWQFLPLSLSLAIEGWIILITGVHEETQEEDLHNLFGDFGEVKNLRLNLDRRTGYVKGYALTEYQNFESAQAAISSMNGAVLFSQIISVDWAFSNGSFKGGNMNKRSPRSHCPRSPRRRYR